MKMNPPRPSCAPNGIGRFQRRLLHCLRSLACVATLHAAAVLAGAPSGGALHLNGGTGSYAIINPFDSFPSGDFTVELWMRSTDTVNAGTPISYATSNGGAGYNDFILYDYRNLDPVVRGVDNYSGAAANDGSWHHLAVTWQQSSGALRLYKDGNLASTPTVAAGYTFVNGGALVLGQEQDAVGAGFSTSQAFIGDCDEVRIWSKARTQAEILSAMYADVSNNTSGLVAYYQFGEGAGSAASNSVSGGQSLNLVGTFWTNVAPAPANFSATINPTWTLVSETFSNSVAANVYEFNAAWISPPGGSVLWQANTNAMVVLSAPPETFPNLFVFQGTNGGGSLLGSSTNGSLNFFARAGFSYVILATNTGNYAIDIPMNAWSYQSPVNDDQADAIPLSNILVASNYPVGSVSVPVPQVNISTNGFTYGATSEQPWEGSANHTAWYSWTAPQTGLLDLSLTGTVVSYLELGTDTNAFTVLAGNATALSYTVTNGQSYLIRVRAASVTDSTFALGLRFTPKPINDNFASPLALFSNPITLSYDMGGGLTWQQTKYLQTNIACIYAATKETGETSSERNTLWYTFTPAQRGLLRIPGYAARMFGGNAYASTWLGTGTSVTSLFQTNRVGIYSAATPGTLANNIESGVPYLVRLGTEWNNFPSDQVIYMAPAFYPSPANDDFENRTPVTLSTYTNTINWEGQTFVYYLDDRASVLGTTLGARKAGTGEVNRNGEDDNVWWSITPSRLQPVTLSTLGSITEDGADQDTYAYVFTESAGTFTQISANNNAAGTLTSLLTFTPAPGTEYKLMICTASSAAPEGPIKLSLTQPQLHADDAFTNAITINSTLQNQSDGSSFETATVYQGIYNPTTETGEADSGSGGSLWFKWTPSVSGTAYLYTTDSNPNTVPTIWVYTGANVTALSRVSSGWTWTYDSTRITCSATVTAGTTYRIALRGGGGIAKLQIQLKGASAMVNTNDNQTSAINAIPETINTVRDGRTAVLNGDASSATFEAGETNLLGVITNRNDNYALNAGTNTLWWQYTTSSNSSQISVATYALTAYIPMRTGTGADPFLNVVNPYGTTVDLAGLGIVANTQYSDFTSPIAGPLRLNKAYSGTQVRVELNYIYVTNTTDAYNWIIGTTTANSKLLAVRNSDHMLGYYNNSFIPLNLIVQPGRDYYFAVEAAGTKMSVWADSVQLGSNLTIYDAGSYWVQWVGWGSGGYLHDVRIYDGLPVQHNAIAIWSGGQLLAVDDDVVTTPTTPNTTYLIQAAPLSGQTNVYLRLNEFYGVPNDDHASAVTLDLTPAIQTFNLPNGQVTVTNAAATVTGSNVGATRANSEYGWNGPIGASVWFKFTAPMNGTVMFDPTASAFDTTLELESTNLWDNASRYPLAASEGAMTYSVTAGTTYFLKLDGHNWGNYALKVYYVLSAVNDSFYAPTSITWQTNTIAYPLAAGTTYVTNFVCNTVSHTFYAGLDRSDEICPSDNTGYSSGPHTAAPSTIWWTFTAPSDGNVTIDASGSSVYTYVAVGAPYYPYSAVSAYGSNVITMRVTKNVAYRIEAGQTTNAFGAAVNLSITLMANPGNDSFYSPTVVTLQTNNTAYTLPNGTVYVTNYSRAVVGNTFAASLDRSDEICPSDNTGFSSGSHAVAPTTIWWTFTSPDNGLLTLDASGSSAYTHIAIGTPYYPYSAMGSYGSNIVTMRVNKDVTYRIEAAQTTNAPSGAAVNLTFNLVALNPNDGFYTPAPLTFQTGRTAYPLPNGTAYLSNYTAGAIGHTFSASLDRSDEICPSDNTGYSSGSHAAAPTTIWWSFTAPDNGRMFVDTFGSSAYSYVAVGTPYYAYSSMGAYGSNSVTMMVSKDSVYRICVAQTNASAGAFINLNAVLQAAHTNDTFPGGIIPFTATTNYATFAEFGFTNVIFFGKVVAHNFSATSQSGNEYFSSYLSGINAANQTIWWNFNAPASGIATISTEGTSLDTLLRLTTVASAGNYGATFVNDDANGGVQSSGQSYLTGGSPYKIEVDTKAGAQGPLNLTVTQPAAPDNDMWGNWTTITEAPGYSDGYQSYSFARVPGDTTQATSQGEDFQSSRGLSVTPTRNVWYKFTSATSGYVRLVIDTPTPVKPVIGVYTGWNSGWQGGGLSGDFWFYAAANATYYFVVEGGASPGPFALNVFHYTGTVPNDNFANRIALTNGVTATGISAGGATRETGETSYYGSWGSVWYNYTADCSGIMVIDTEGSEADTVLGVFTGNAVNALSPVASSDNVDGGISSRVYFTATQGTDYKIQLMFKNTGRFRITARSLCSQVSALPSQGAFNQPTPIRLFATGSPIYYSTNGASYQIYAPPIPTYTNVVWCVSDGSGVITKTNGGSGSWNAGFISAQTFAGDGYVEMVALTLSECMFGLDALDSGVNWTDIDYGLCPRTSGNIDIFEAGVQKASAVTTYNPGDLLRVQRVGNTVQFLKNGAVFFTSSTPSSGTVHLDASVSTQGAPIGQFTIGNGTGNSSALTLSGGDAGGNATLSAFVPGGVTNSWSYKFKAPAPVLSSGSPVSWTNPTGGVLITDNSLLKPAGGNSWNANAISVESFPDDGSLEYVVTTNHLMIGLDTVTTNSSYTDIEYALHTYADGSGQNFAVYENGARNFLLNGVVQMGDILRIERQGATIRYYQNGTLRYTSSIPSTGTLHVDACIYYVGYPSGPVYLQRGLAPELRANSPPRNTTHYTQAALPGEAVPVQETDAVFPDVLTSTTPINVHARNYQAGYLPSDEVRRNLGSVLQTLSPLVFNVSSTNFTAPATLSVTDPSVHSGTFTITYPDGSSIYIFSTNSTVSFADKGSGKYSASLSVAGLGTAPTSFTNLNFQVSALSVAPSSQAFSVPPLTVTAITSYSVNVYYTLAASGLPNIPYSGPLPIGASNATVRFMATRAGYMSQFVTNTYVYSPELVVTPTGTFSNATTFSIQGGTDMKFYQVGAGAWQTYTGPFTLDGVPGGSSSIRAYFVIEPGTYSLTNVTPVAFKAANPLITPASGQVSGSYTITMTTVTEGATIDYAIKDPAAGPIALAEVTNVYSQPITWSSSANVLAVARKADYQDSISASAGYLARVPTPVFVTSPTNSSGPLTITVASADNYGGTYRMTQPGGQMQSKTATNASATFVINESGTYQLILKRTGWVDSDAATSDYTFSSEDVILNPPAGCLYATTNATLSWNNGNPKTPKAYYTLDGSLPTTNSSAYTVGVPVSGSLTLTLLVTRDGYAPRYLTNQYDYLPPMGVSPAPGTNNTAIAATLNRPEATAIYYQINYGSWSIYQGAFPLDGIGGGTVTVGTRYDTAGCPGPTNQFIYVFKALPPDVQPGSTNFTEPLTITATEPTAGATVFYELGDAYGNNAAGNAITNVYSAPITISSTRQMIFEAHKAGYQNSVRLTNTYSSPLPTPFFTTPGGTYTSPLNAFVQSTLAGTPQTFVLTFPNGAKATNNASGSSTYFTVNETGDYQLQVRKANWQPSALNVTNYGFQVADLQVTPASQLFSDPFQVAASQNSNPKPMTIYYTDDGSAPTTNSLVYTNTITVTDTITLRFMGWRQGYAPQYIDRTYTYAPGLVISPLSSTNSSGITVTMTPYLTNSAIYYSINDSDWTPYTAPFGIDGASNGVAVVKAYAVTGPTISPTNTVIYTFKVAGLTVNPASQNLNGGVSVTAATTALGANIYYASGNDGGETPSVAAITNLYTGPIMVSGTKALIFEGRKAGYLPSDQVVRIYSATLPTPHFVTPSNTFTNQTAITVQSGLTGYGATFTLQTPSGSILAISSGTDSATFNINETGTYQLNATKPNWLPSGSTNQSFNFVVADLKVMPASGTFGTSNLVVTAQSSISNPKPLKIYYTTVSGGPSGEDPTTNSMVYIGGITITNITTFKWLATRDYYAPQYATNTYTWVPGIALSPSAGTFSNATTFTLSTLAPGAQLFYSTNAADWHAYTAPIVMDGFNAGTGTLRATYTNSSGSGPTNSFTINFVAGTPQVSPENQTVYSNVIVTAATPTLDARIYYSLSSSGFDPVNLSNLYAPGLTITNRSFLTFQARKDGYQNSVAVQRKYIQKLPAPIQLTTGDFTNWVTAFVELPQPVSGLSIVVMHPALTNETRGAPISATTGKPLGYYIANSTGPYVVKAIAADWEDSDAITNVLGFYVRDLATPDDQKFNAPVFQVSADSSLFPINPKPLTIYFTTDGSEPGTNSILYAGPVPITTSTMFKWLAMRNGYSPQIRTNTYTYVPPLTVTPPPGIYSNAISVALTSPNDEPIFFSLNGGSWQSYAGSMTFDGYVDGNLLVQAIYTGGATNFFPYTFLADPPVVTPESQILDSGPITLSAANGNTIGAAVVYFEGDAGGGVANTNRTMILYTEPIAVPASRSYLFQARKNDYQPSALVGRTFTSQLPAPTVLTAPGIFTAPVWVQVQSGLPGYGGVYLMINPDGTTNKVTTGSPSVTFQVNASGTYQFQMQRSGWLDSAAAAWTAEFKVADLTVTPAGGLISVPNTPVTAKAGTNPKPLKIYYTLDGTVPTTNSSIYAQPILINEDTAITWLATRDGYDSMLQTNVYVFVAGVNLSPIATFYTNATTFALTPLGPSDGIYYRTNASDWMPYTQSFTLDGTTDISFYSQLGGKFSITNTYPAVFKVGAVSVLPNSTVFTNAFNISASVGTTNAMIVYRRGDEDAGAPPRSLEWVTNIYTGPIAQTSDNSSRYLFNAIKPGYTSADWVERIYTAKMPLPTSLLGTNLQIAAPTQNTLTMFRPCRVRSWTNTFASGQYLNSSEQPFVNVTYIHPGTYWYRASRHGWADSDDLPVTVTLRQPDNFSDRIDLSLLSLGTNYNNGQAPQVYGALGDITGATREADEWDGTFDDNGLITTDPARVTSLWYRWVAPTNGLAQIKIFNNYTGDTNYFIYGVSTGGGIGGLNPILMAHQPSEFIAVAGTEYHIAVNSGITAGQAGEFQVQIDYYPTPLNDLLTNAIPIVAGQVYSGYTHAATNEPGEISGNSTWWQFSTLQGGTLEVPLTTGVEARLWQGDYSAPASKPTPTMRPSNRVNRSNSRASVNRCGGVTRPASMGPSSSVRRKRPLISGRDQTCCNWSNSPTTSPVTSSSRWRRMRSIESRSTRNLASWKATSMRLPLIMCSPPTTILSTRLKSPAARTPSSPTASSTPIRNTDIPTGPPSN